LSKLKLSVRSFKTALVNYLTDIIPFCLLKVKLPKQFIVYGHLVSSRKHIVSRYYQYPSIEEFREFINWFLALGYEFVSLPDFLRNDNEKKILISFDDGFRAVYTDLHPYMKSHNIPYALFILTEPLSDKHFYINTIKPDAEFAESGSLFLSEQEIRFLKAEGVHIGFHTRSHLKLEDYHRIESIEIAKELSVPHEYADLLSKPVCFAYPYMAPENFEAFNDFMTRKYGYDVFFDTKGFRLPRRNHFFRVSIDSEKALKKGDRIKFLIKRQLLLSIGKSR
jgi:peptidoglycan/xylan/chitin deacetylase (PgdA/CDA1 family)